MPPPFTTSSSTSSFENITEAPGGEGGSPDPENFLSQLYGPNGTAEHAGSNYANYSNDEYDRLFRQMRVMENGPERQAIIERMLTILRRDAPWQWGYFPRQYALYGCQMVQAGLWFFAGTAKVSVAASSMVDTTQHRRSWSHGPARAIARAQVGPWMKYVNAFMMPVDDAICPHAIPVAKPEDAKP